MIAQHGIQGGDHLAHDSDDDDLGLLFGSRKTLVKGFESGVVSACAEGRHIKDVADRHAATIDAAMAAEFAAVEVVGRDPDEAAICFRLIRPSSGKRAMSVKARTGPTPGIEIKI